MAREVGFWASPNEAGRNKCVADLRRDFKIFVKAQDIAVKNPFVAKIIRSSPFNLTVMKGIVYLLFGPHDKPAVWVKERFHRVVHLIFAGWGQTKIVEDKFEEMREREKSDTTNKAHNPIQYWACTTEMNTIGKHNRDQLESSEACELPKQ